MPNPPASWARSNSSSLSGKFSGRFWSSCGCFTATPYIERRSRLIASASEQTFSLRHRHQLAKRNPTRQVVEPAGTGDNRLFGRKPTVAADARRDRLAGLDLRVLHIHRADADLSVAQQAFVVAGHVMLDQVRRALDLTNQIGLVAPGVEVAMADLRVVLFADRV